MGDNLEFVERAGKESVPTLEDMRNYLAMHGASNEALDWKQDVEIFNPLSKEKKKIEETLFSRITLERMMPLLYSQEDMESWLGIASARAMQGPAQGNAMAPGTTVTGAGYTDDEDVPF
jgi:hypothetical protein